MRAAALIGLATLSGLLGVGCGSSSPPTPTKPEGVTTTAQIAAMKKRLAEDEELRPVYKRERVECEATHSEYEYGKACAEPLTEKLAQLTVLDEKLADELMLKAGKGCQEALRAAPYFDRIEKRAIAGCERDVGKAP
ncbi:MAG TPA: hypothetical protein VMF55_13045 [Solirubrobacterales bacterium]|nr:hypothetical protein [Solirubrobacterales bacterium]